jgi:threonine/homoserine efflux transporter RhtA
MKALRVLLAVCGVITLLYNGYVFSSVDRPVAVFTAIATTLVWTYIFIKETLDNTP